MKKQTKTTNAAGATKYWLLGLLAAVSIVWIFWPQHKPIQSMQTSIGQPQASAPQLAKSFTTPQAYEYFQKLCARLYPDVPENSYFTPFMKERLRWIWSATKAYSESQDKRGLDLKLVMTVPPNNGALMRSFQFADRIKHVEVFAPRMFEERDYFERNNPDDHELREKNSFAIALVHETIHLDVYHPELNDILEFNEDYYREESRAWWETVEKVIHPLLLLNQPMDETPEAYDVAYTSCKGRRPCAKFEQEIRQRSFRKQ